MSVETPSAEEEGVLVLLVDDDETWANSTAQLLEHQRREFSVETATDLSTASATFAAHDPDCVVCDYQLEHGTGLDLFDDVRKQAPDRPFILITGEGNEMLASDAISQQVTDYIPKRSLGGRDDLLARRVEQAVESYRTQQALDRERRSKKSMLDILTATSSREGVARQFCTHLVRDRGYDCAWIGTVDHSRGLVPQTGAGEDEYVDAAIEPGTTPQDGTEPALAALASHDLHVVSPIRAGDGDGSDGWRKIATRHGFTSAAAVPIAHEGTTFGVLAVYTTAGEVDAGERALLRDHGETIGYALRSAEWKESLLSTTPVAVQIELSDDRVPLVALDQWLPPGSRIEVLTTVLREETLLSVTRITGSTPAEVRAGADEVPAIQEVTITRRDDDLQCELVVSSPTPERILAEHGGRLTDAVVEHGRASIAVSRPDGSTIQSLIDAVRREYPDAGVQSVRSSGEEPERLTTRDLRRELTDKQRTALELAFYEGYFQRPRDNNTTEVAEKLGVSRPTFTQHLRTAQQKLFIHLVDE
jgi:predicted DNA binding protein/FixJ family two-component response regulator